MFAPKPAIREDAMFWGSICALITPFRDGKVDERAFQDLVEWQIQEGTHGLVPCGTTGESPTLSHEEHMRVVELCIEAANRRVPVIAGTGSNSTSSSPSSKAGACTRTSPPASTAKLAPSNTSSSCPPTWLT